MSWWSDKPTFITPSWEILSGTLTNMWSINTSQAILIGDFIICVLTQLKTDFSRGLFFIYPA